MHWYNSTCMAEKRIKEVKDGKIDIMQSVKKR